MDTEQKQEKPFAQSKWVAESLLIFALPVAAYFLTLSYIIGYAEFFRIPMDFISVNTVTLFDVLAGRIWIWAVLLDTLFMTVFFAIPYNDHPFVRAGVRIFFPLAAVLFIQFTLGVPWPEWVLVPAFFLVIAIYSFVPPLFLRGVSYAEKIRTWFKPMSIETVWLRYSRTTFAGTASTILFCIALGSYVSFCVGRATAQRHSEFLVLGSAPDTVVLMSFGGNLVVAPFDRKTKEVERSFSVLKIAEDPKLVFRWEVIGPLQLKPPSTVTPQSAATSSLSPPNP